MSFKKGNICFIKILVLAVSSICRLERKIVETGLAIFNTETAKGMDMKRFSKILCALDVEKDSDELVIQSLKIASDHQANLTFITVLK